MKESYGEDLASYTDPESCTVARKGGCEGLTGACAGGLLSREIMLARGADVVSVSGRLHSIHRHGKRYGDPARSENLCMHRNTSRENRERIGKSVRPGPAGQLGLEDAMPS